VPHERSTTPAFRAGGALSAVVATDDIRNILCVVAQFAVPDWSLYDYGAHNLRIGRENAWRATDEAMPEFLNGMTTHSSTEGHMPYSRSRSRRFCKSTAEQDFRGFREEYIN
jgi:hypothetical protein